MSVTFTEDEKVVLKQIAGFLVSLRSGGTTSSGATVPASDAELQSQYGDPQVRRDPRRWAGNSYMGAKFSQCPTDYLLCKAEELEYFANKNRNDPNAKKTTKGKFYWELDLRDASRARGWAARNRGIVMPPPENVVGGPSGGTPDGGGPSDADEGWAP